MTPDQHFARIIRISIAGFLLVFVYFIFADMAIPVTPQAMVTHLVTKVAPQVGGEVKHVAVKNDQTVAKGQLLFELDPRPYQLAVKDAELAVEQVRQSNAELDASIDSAVAAVESAQAQLVQSQREAQRLHELYTSHSTSKQLSEEADLAVTSAQTQLHAANAELSRLKVSRGAKGDDNLQLRQAQNQLAQARLNLQYTRVVAAESGIVTNLQLQQGNVISAASPVLALVSRNNDIVADFREKAIHNLKPGVLALASFDGQPGHIYSAKVVSVDAGVSNGQFAADGSLATPVETDRWVRDAQRLRVHLKLTDQEYPLFASGARATIQLLPENPVLRFIGKVQLKCISLLHYIY